MTDPTIREIKAALKATSPDGKRCTEEGYRVYKNATAYLKYLLEQWEKERAKCARLEQELRTLRRAKHVEPMA